MRLRQTHTFAILELSAAAFEEIKEKLELAGYEENFIYKGKELIIDMNGIAVKTKEKYDKKTIN